MPDAGSLRSAVGPSAQDPFILQAEDEVGVVGGGAGTGPARWPCGVAGAGSCSLAAKGHARREAGPEPPAGGSPAAQPRCPRASGCGPRSGSRPERSAAGTRSPSGRGRAAPGPPRPMCACPPDRSGCNTATSARAAGRPREAAPSVSTPPPLAAPRAQSSTILGGAVSDHARLVTT